VCSRRICPEWKHTFLPNKFMYSTDHVEARVDQLRKNYRSWERQLQVSGVHGPQ